MLDLPLTWISLALSAVALVVAYVSARSAPRRTVYELRGRVEDLEYAAEQTAARLTKRARSEGMEQARQAHQERSARRDRIESEAVAILEQQRAAAGQGELLPADEPAARAALRARIFGGVKH